MCKRNKDIFSEQLSQYQKRILPTTPLLADKSVQVTSGIIKPENEGTLNRSAFYPDMIANTHKFVDVRASN